MNRAKCKLCGDVIVSKYRHDFQTCTCGEIFVDGGNDYFRGGAKNWENFIDMSDETLEELCSKITPENRHPLVDFGPPVGRECEDYVGDSDHEHDDRIL